MKNKNLHIAIFSTLFAVALWLAINMGSEYQTVISVPLVLENIKPNRSLAKAVPSAVNVSVHASGWQLVGLYFVPNVRYVLDLSDISNRFSFVTSKDIMERLNLPQGIRAVDIKPDTIAVVLDDKIKKIVPVEPVVTMTFREGTALLETSRPFPIALLSRAPKPCLIKSIDGKPTRSCSRV